MFLKGSDNPTAISTSLSQLFHCSQEIDQHRVSVALNQRHMNFKPPTSAFLQEECYKLNLSFSRNVFSGQLQQEGIRLIVPVRTLAVRGDGNCFFSPFSLILTGTPDYAGKKLAMLCFTWT